MTDEIPDRLGPYRVDSLVAIGGMGEVYRGWDERHQRAVALKRLVPEDVEDYRLRRRFRREARAAARLDHPTIPRVHEILETEHGDWIVMDFIEGTTLAKRVEAEGPPEMERLLEIAERIAEGLAEAHAKNVIHRDLKAENILLADDGRVFILDFGLAKLDKSGSDTSTLTMRGAMVGTCRAMSPEQAVSDQIDHRSDLFSLGTLLYEVLAGESPFEAATPMRIVARVVGSRQPPIRSKAPWVPADLEALIDQLMEKEPDERPRDATEVAAALRRIRLDCFAGSKSGPPYLGAALILTVLGLMLSGLFLTSDLDPEVGTEAATAAVTPPAPPGALDGPLAAEARIVGNLLLRRSFVEAEARYAEALGREPKRPDLLLGHADALRLLGREDEAVAGYWEVVDEVEGRPRGWQTEVIRARALVQLGRVDTALEIAAKVARAERGNPSVAYEIAVIQCLAGHPAEAVGHALEALRDGLDPTWLDSPWLESLPADPRIAAAIETGSSAN